MSESRSVIDSIKNQVKNGGSAFKNFFSIRTPGTQVRVRFLDNLDKAIEITMHTRWQDIDHPCLSYYGKSCPNCDNPDVKDVVFYALNVYNYESKKVEIFFFKASKNSPLNQMVMIYDNSSDDPRRKTITNCDLIIQRNGTGFDTNYVVIQGRKGKFPKADEVKKFTKKQIFELVLKAHNKTGSDVDDYEDPEEDEYYDDEYEEKPRKRKASSKSSKSSKKSTKKKKYEEEYEDYDDEDYEDEYDDDYEEDDYDDYEDEDDEVPFDYDEEDEEEEEYEPPKRRKSSRKRR